MSSPKVTVVTSYYNRAPVVRRTLESILDQTFTDFELHAVDDNSTDATWARMQALAAERRDPRLKLHRNEPNKGFVQTMIDTIEASRGTYVAVQGSGDVSAPTRLEKQVALLDARPELSTVGCFYTNIVETGGVRRPRRIVADDVDLAQLLKGNVFSHGEVMYRRAAYDAAGGYRPAFVFSQDYDLFLRLIRVGPFATVPELLYDRYVAFDGVSYRPEKFIRQTQLGLLAQRLATEPADAQAALLEDLDWAKLDRLVPRDDPKLQRKLASAVARALFWRNPALAHELVAGHVTSRGQARLWSLAIGVADSRLGGVLMEPLRLALGIQATPR